MTGQAGTAVPLGRRTLVARPLGGRVSTRVDLRVAAVCVALVVATAVVSVLALGTGDFAVAVPDVLRALAGLADGPVHTVVVEWRLPRVALAVAAGAALGVSGAIFQSLTRNPLGSPDIVGFSTGAYTGALLVILLWRGSYYETAAGALAGGIATAALVYLLAFRRGVQGFRLIVVGIGVSAMLASVNTWLMLEAELVVAMQAAVWGAGSLNGVSAGQAWPTAALATLLLLAAFVLGPRLRLLELGDDTATALGLRAEPARLALVAVGVALTAVVTAAAGPIAFIALAAPQLARRLTRSAGTPLVASAALGALLLSASDLAAQRVFAPTQLPVGIVTVCIGGGYLIWLLVREARRA